jgi:hypothetical protein
MSVINRTIKNNAANMQRIYTVPSGKTAVVTSINHCNHSSSERFVFSFIEDTSVNVDQYTSINQTSTLSPYTSIEIIGGGHKLVLNAGDGLSIFKISSNTVDTIVTLMEID